MLINFRIPIFYFNLKFILDIRVKRNRSSDSTSSGARGSQGAVHSSGGSYGPTGHSSGAVHNPPLPPDPPGGGWAGYSAVSGLSVSGIILRIQICRILPDGYGSFLLFMSTCFLQV